MKKNIHIVPHGNQWQVKPENSRPASTHRTQQNAINRGIPLAKENKSELVIHRPNGTIRDKDSYGNDPRNVKDTKH